jgi:hypothetical protein
MLISSQKCHPELAGEGIQHNRNAAKQWYCIQNLVEKHTKDKFRKLVIQSLDQVKINLRMELKHSKTILKQQTRTLRPQHISLTELSGSLIGGYLKMVAGLIRSCSKG